MSPRIRRYTALVGTAALVGGGGLGVAQAATDSGARSTTAKRSSLRGPGGPTQAQLTALADRLGVTAAKLKAAMTATRPAKPAGKRAARGPGDMAAALATALGVETSAVQEILEANRPARGDRPAPGTKPGHTALVGALAKGLNIETATVAAAVAKVDAAKEAEHGARHQEMAAALAEELGLDTADVAAALEATRPAKP
jgi:hypothetical protein